MRMKRMKSMRRRKKEQENDLSDATPPFRHNEPKDYLRGAPCVIVVPPPMSDTEPVKASILIVDDEREHAQVMCEALQRQGHKCDVTYSLSEARHKLERRRYDVVVTDLMMEGRKDGLDVLAAAKKQQPAPPVILVTAHGAIRTYKEAMGLGAFDFIEKPLDLEDFRAQVNRAAQQAALQRQNQVLQEQISELSGDRTGFEA